MKLIDTSLVLKQFPLPPGGIMIRQTTFVWRNSGVFLLLLMFFSLLLQWTCFHYFKWYYSYCFGFGMENDSIPGFFTVGPLMDFCPHIHTHTHTHFDRLWRRKKRKNELLIMPSNYGVWPWERYDPGEITSNSHLSQQIEWKTLVRGEEKRRDSREDERAQEEQR